MKNLKNSFIDYISVFENGVYDKRPYICISSQILDKDYVYIYITAL